MAEQLTFGFDNSEFCQRWNERRSSWRRTSEGGFDPNRFVVRPLHDTRAKAFVKTHHYSGSWPASRFAFSLWTAATSSAPERLCGVLALGIPMHEKVLTRAFPRLAPYTQSLELSRLVLTDEVPSNAESWFTTKALRAAYAAGIRGVIAHSDPVPRLVKTDGNKIIHGGHVGYVYQGCGFDYVGRTSSRTITLLPDGTILSDRAKSKIRSNDRGHAGAQRRLVALGARERAEGEDGRTWLKEVLETMGAEPLRHSGNHRYIVQIDPRTRSRIHPLVGLPYPKGTPATTLARTVNQKQEANR